MLNRSIALFVLFLAAAGMVARQSRPEPSPARSTFNRFPDQIQSWKGVDDYLNRVYTSPDRAQLGLYVGYYGSQRQGDSIHSPMNCLPGAGWEPLSKSSLTIPVSSAAGAAVVDANRYVIQKGLNRQLVLYWYQSHGRTVASEYWSKLYLVRDAVRLNRTDAALVRVIVPINPNADDGEMRAERQASDFVKSMFPLLPQYLPS